MEALLPLVHSDDDDGEAKTEAAISEADQAERQDAISMAAALNNPGK